MYLEYLQNEIIYAFLLKSYFRLIILSIFKRVHLSIVERKFKTFWKKYWILFVKNGGWSPNCPDCNPLDYQKQSRGRWKLNSLLINIIYLVVSSLEMQRRLIQTKVHYKIFYSISKETTHKPSKVAATENFSSNMYVIVTTCFSECFLFHMITGRHCFL